MKQRAGTGRITTLHAQPQEGVVTKRLMTFAIAASLAVFSAAGPVDSILGSRIHASEGIALAADTTATQSVYLQPDTRPVKSLSLREAIETAVANNLDVAIRKRDPESARLGVTQARSAFDPLLTSTGEYGRSKSEPLSDFASQGSKFWSLQAGIAQTLQEGFRYTATWNSNKNTTIYPAGASSLG